jgi:alkylation response protein AidB-like acyl-CoA dehydrogenase
MHPEPTNEQRELKESVERFWREQVTPERLVAWSSEAHGIDERCWEQIGELGWFGIGVPEDRGGSGLGLVEVACVLEECGRGLIPLSVIRAIRGATALVALDDTAEELQDVARGFRRVALALDERSSQRLENLATRIDDTCRVTGEKWFVAMPSAELHIVAARHRDDVALVLVDGGAAQWETLRAFDGAEQGVVRYDNAPILRILTEPGRGAAALGALRRMQTSLALAEMVGGMCGALDMTVAYVMEREQFGQKIAVFQAVQHQIADMSTVHTASRHLAWQAITRLAAGTEEGVELETAAAYVGRSFKDLTLTAHHLHGGAGYVVEHPLHLHSERAQSLCVRYTPEAAALAAVASHLLD